MKSKRPIMLLKGLVLLPTQEVRIELNNDITKLVVQLASEEFNKELIVICPQDFLEEKLDVQDLPMVGVLAKVKTRTELPNGLQRIALVGIERVQINNYFNNKKNKKILEANFEKIDIPKIDFIEETALIKKLVASFKDYVNMSPYFSNSVFSTIEEIESLDKLTDIITLFMPFPIEKKQGFMQEVNALKRAENLILEIAVETQIVAIDLRIEDDLREELEKNQKEFILKEKVKQIQKELGEESSKTDEINSFKEQLEELNLSPKTYKKISSEINKYELSSPMSPENSILYTYLNWVLNLPWNKESTDEKDINLIKKRLDSTHFGLEKAKERIIEFIAIKNRNKNLKSPIICLVGPPGVGKTSFAKTIALSLNKEFYKISVGGLNDSAELVGHRRTYLGSNPGKIIQALCKCEAKNPLLLIDEIDKMVKDFKGDPASSLLDILDSEQNNLFVDNYIEEPFDLSKVLFILTANYIENIPEELKDRLEIINLDSYTEFEKLEIAKNYLLPNIYKNHLIKVKDIKFSEDVLKFIINGWTKEAGVRELERELSAIVRKIIVQCEIKQEKIKISLKKEDIQTYLGLIKYEDKINILVNKSGLVNGLAWTPYGGRVMPLEAVIYEGKGKISFTGMAGDVMKESLDVAVSYIMSNKDAFKINDYYFSTKDIHIHVLEGAIRKNGPSAGVTIVTSLLSLILNKEVSLAIAMTGEISLRGEILKVGGIKEKLIGAYNDGIKKVFIPWFNKNDLEELSSEVKDKLEIIFVRNYEEIFKDLFSN